MLHGHILRDFGTLRLTWVPCPDWVGITQKKHQDVLEVNADERYNDFKDTPNSSLQGMPLTIYYVIHCPDWTMAKTKVDVAMWKGVSWSGPVHETRR